MLMICPIISMLSSLCFQKTPVLSILEVETISGPAYITPVFRTDERIPICERPSRVDNFWFTDRKFLIVQVGMIFIQLI
jgi:hypothetical protein